MSIGDFASGFTQSISDQLTKERDTQRKREDDNIAYQQGLIKMIMERPDFDPHMLGRALDDLMNLGNAKAGQRKQKKGTAGFYGETESPTSELLKAVHEGMIPIFGEPIPEVPTKAAGIPDPTLSLPQAQMKQTMDLPGIGMVGASNRDNPQDNWFNHGMKDRMPGSIGNVGMGPQWGNDLPQNGGITGNMKPTPLPTGQAALMEPIQVPPKGSFVPGTAKSMASAAQDMMAYQSKPHPQPLLRTPEEMAQQEGSAAGIKAGAIDKAKRQSEYEYYKEIGFSDQEIKQMLMAKARGASGRVTVRTEDYINEQTGDVFTVKIGSDGSITDLADRPIVLNPQTDRKIGISPFQQTQFIQNDAGDVTQANINRYTGATDFNKLQGVKGRTSPQGQVINVAGPNGESVPVRMPRQGTGATPVTVPADPNAPNGNRVVANAAPSAAETTAQVQNMTALQQLQRMQQTYKDEFVGPAMGRYNTLKTLAPESMASLPEGFADFNATVTQFTNTMIKAITGAQMSEPEATRIKGQLPQVNDRGDVFQAKLKQSLNNIGDIARAYIAKGRPVPKELQDVANQLGVNVNPPGGATVAPGTAPAGGAKVATQMQIHQYAQEHHITYQDAANLFTAKGYQIH